MEFSPPICRDHFNSALDRDAAKALFKASVSYVSIETFSYCNRKCWFCANSFIPRADLKANQVIDPALFEKVVQGLGEIDYDKTVNMSGYNEPMADKRILEHISFVRRLVPKARISIFSNGDYLTRAFLEALHEAGLNELYLSIHTGNNEALHDDKVKKRIAHYQDHLGLDVRMSHMEPGKQYKGRIQFKDMFIQLYEPNMKTMGSDMGGLIKDVANAYNRTEPCFEPTRHFTVEFNGNVVPCCRIRTDADTHKNLALCSMDDVDDIFQAYMHPTTTEWRKSVSFTGEKTFPCDTCDNSLYKGNVIVNWRLKRMQAQLSAREKGAT